MKKQITIIISSLLVLGSQLSAHEEQAPEQREMLSHHQTIAEYQGTEYHQCRGRTSMCPGSCGHSGEFAIFKVTKYLKYEKPGQYGDPKQETYRIRVSDAKRVPLDTQLAKQITKLKKNDQVLLEWTHDYVTTASGSKYPERTIKKLELTNTPS